MYTTILVPLDGSKRAEKILPHVEELAQRYDAKVIFLQVIEPLPLIVGPEGTHMTLYQQELDQQQTRAESYLAGIQGEFREKGIQARARIAYSPVVEAILDTAELEGADLIAIASHGRTGLSQVFYGSVAAGVLHRADRPLLLIRSRDSE
jgi:nucleotide-binding universal stress UspA family protein